MALVTTAHDWARVRRTIGLALIIVAPALAYNTWSSNQPPLVAMAIATRNGKLPANPYTTNLAPAFWAKASMDGKWGPTGFATLGTVGFLLGAVLLLSATTSRRADRA